jgi:hypothetical protein
MLDTISWTPDVVAFIKSVGNAKSNSIFEATLDQSKKITAKDRRDVKQAFIVSKYVQGVWKKEALE